MALVAPGPNPVGASEIRKPRFRTDAGAGEKYRITGLIEQLRQFVDFVFLVEDSLIRTRHAGLDPASSVRTV
jgi:hypothetical protein